ncbi:SMP-30/gluconolactonase/LRE family protein [Candidatus Latescibacterota bacterium]
MKKMEKMKTLQKNIMLCLVLSLGVFVAMSCGQQAGEQAVVETAQGPTASLADIVPAGATLTKVTGDIEFDTAGSPCYFEGDLYFTNNMFEPRENSQTHVLHSMSHHMVLRDYNGVTTAIHQTGKGTFYCCEMVGHKVIEMGTDGTVLRTVAGEYNGVRLDGPNDMVIDKSGGIYFTDSRFSPGEELMQDTPAVYYVKPDGSIMRIIDDIEFPNGIDLSPDGKILYVANTRGPNKGRFVIAYDVLDDGTVTNRRNFAELLLSAENEANEGGTSGADGSAVDSAGNVYVATTQGIGIQVINSAGVHLGSIPCDVATNNLYFGGEDMKTLFVSAVDGIYSIELSIPGLKIPLE